MLRRILIIFKTVQVSFKFAVVDTKKLVVFRRHVDEMRFHFLMFLIKELYMDSFSGLF